jgi:hypothetical protein
VAMFTDVLLYSIVSIVHHCAVVSIRNQRLMIEQVVPVFPFALTVRAGVVPEDGQSAFKAAEEG